MSTTAQIYRNRTVDRQRAHENTFAQSGPVRAGVRRRSASRWSRLLRSHYLPFRARGRTKRAVVRAAEPTKIRAVTLKADAHGAFQARKYTHSAGSSSTVRFQQPTTLLRNAARVAGAPPRSAHRRTDWYASPRRNTGPDCGAYDRAGQGQGPARGEQSRAGAHPPRLPSPGGKFAGVNKMTVLEPLEMPGSVIDSHVTQLVQRGRRCRAAAGRGSVEENRFVAWPDRRSPCSRTARDRRRRLSDGSALSLSRVIDVCEVQS